MKIFIDTNIILDVFLKRKGLFDSSARVLSLHQHGHELGANVITFTNAFYLLSKHKGSIEAQRSVRYLAEIVTYESISSETFNNALYSTYRDLEDALQYYSALAHSYEIVCTRNVKDYKNPAIPVLTPEEVLIRNQ